jgi:hypothetical protein
MVSEREREREIGRSEKSGVAVAVDHVHLSSCH